MSNPSVGSFCLIKNEKIWIREHLRSWLPILDQMVFYDGGSTDGTLKIAEGLTKENPGVRLLHHPRNLGLGLAYKTGLAAAQKDFVFYTPADDAFSEEELKKLVSPLGKTDIIVGFISNPEVRPLLRRVISRAYTICVNLIFNLNLPYYHGAVYRTSWAQQVDITTASFAFQAELLVKMMKKGCSWQAVGFEISERISGASKAASFKNIFGVPAALLHLVKEIYVKPLYLRFKRLLDVSISPLRR